MKEKEKIKGKKNKTYLDKIINCKICNRKINFSYEFGKCKTDCEKDIIIKHNFHMNCFLKYPRQDNFDIKNEYYKGIIFRNCPNCNIKILTKSNIYTCPVCNKCNREAHEYEHICQNDNCKKEFKSYHIDTKFCPECIEKQIFISKHTCSKCHLFDENLERDQNGRGYNICECHYKWNKEHWDKYNSSEKAKEVSSKNMIKYIHSEEGQKHIKDHNEKLRIFNIETNECNKNCKKYNECNEKENRLKNYSGYCEDYYFHTSQLCDPEYFIYNLEGEDKCNIRCIHYNDCNFKNLRNKNKYGYCYEKVNERVEKTGVASKEWREFNCNIECNLNYKFYNICNDINNNNNNLNDKIMKNKWGWCEKSLLMLNKDYYYKICDKCQNYTPHNVHDECLVCKNEYIYCKRHNRFESIYKYNTEQLPNNKIINFCTSCNLETPHKYNHQTRKLECQVCNGNLVYNFYINKFVTLENFELIEENKNQERYYMYVLNNKGIDSTISNIKKYKYLSRQNNLSFESLINSLVWCNHCERWETPSFNSRPNHWMFWAAETKQWMDDNSDKVSLAKKIIVGLNDLLNSPVITGVYGWFINDKISYVGESMDVLTRSWNHIMYIFEEPDYWYDVIDYIEKNKIEVKILKSVDRNDQKYINLSSKEFKSQVLKPLELDFISKLHPDSQKCDGTDHIRPINQRQIKINK